MTTSVQVHLDGYFDGWEGYELYATYNSHVVVTSRQTKTVEFQLAPIGKPNTELSFAKENYAGYVEKGPEILSGIF